ncbi:MAG: Mur ligase domain-containing protein [Candidatus Saccharimonadales bacterium]
MHIYFSGIGGTGIGPLALIAKQAGYGVSGSDATKSDYIDYLRDQGIKNVHIGQSRAQIAKVHQSRPIDWFVYSSALPKTDTNHPELVFCQENAVKTSKRDELLNKIIKDKGLQMVAVAGTHGKTTTTAMAIWVLKQLGEPISYSVGAKIGFGDMGTFNPKSRYFIYEADEFDRNFLSFYPELSLITGIDWDHPDIYPTRESYNETFLEFIGQSRQTYLWHNDAERLGLEVAADHHVLDEKEPAIEQIKLLGLVNRQNAWLAAQGLGDLMQRPASDLIKILEKFPGVSRRFEQIVPGLLSDYAHTPAKITGALQLAQEVAGNKVVVVYEGLHNTRQHFIKDSLEHLFDGVKQLYIVPSYLAREDQALKTLLPTDLLNLLSSESKSHSQAMQLNQDFKNQINQHLKQNDLVLCLSAGGSGSLDEWLRKEFAR